MKKNKLFLFSLIIILTAAAAYLASNFPDGLDSTAEKLGFAKAGKAAEKFLLNDYHFRLLPEGGLATFMAGFTGVIIIILVFQIVKKLLMRNYQKLMTKQGRKEM